MSPAQKTIAFDSADFCGDCADEDTDQEAGLKPVAHVHGPGCQHGPERTRGPSAFLLRALGRAIRRARGRSQVRPAGMATGMAPVSYKPAHSSFKESKSGDALLQASKSGDALTTTTREHAHAFVSSAFHVRNMCCESEVRLARFLLAPLDGVGSVDVDIVDRTMYITHCADIGCTGSSKAVCAVLNGAHLGVSLVTHGRVHAPEQAQASWGACIGAHTPTLHLLSLWALFLVGVAADLASSAALDEGQDEGHSAPTRWRLGARAVLLVCAIAGLVPLAFEVGREALSLRALRLEMRGLVVLALLGTLILGEWLDAALLSTVYCTAKRLEVSILRGVHAALDGAMAQRSPPTTALSVERGRLAVSELAVGELVELSAGEQSVADCVIESGEVLVQLTLITGELDPVMRRQGDSLPSGADVLKGSARVRLSATAADSALAQLDGLVRRAQAQSEAGGSRLAVDRFAARWTPAVVCVAVIVLACALLQAEPSKRAHWMHSSFVLLLLGCPCSLVLAAPIPTLLAIASAARRGVIFKRAAALESLGRTAVVALDKTGTLTTGDFVLVEVAEYPPAASPPPPATAALEARTGGHAKGGSACEKLRSTSLSAYGRAALRAAAAIEARSTHPLAAAIVAAGRGCVGNAPCADLAPSELLPALTDHEQRDGTGAAARVSGFSPAHLAHLAAVRAAPGDGEDGLLRSTADGEVATVAIGNMAMLDAAAAEAAAALPAGAAQRERQRAWFAAFCASHAGQNCVAVLADGVVTLALALADELREGTAELVRELRGLDCAVHVLSGAERGSVKALALELGADGHEAELLPEDKRRWVAERATALSRDGRAIAMVGDGTNDAPALAAATVGIAMGASGAALVAEAADVVLLRSELRMLPRSIRLSRTLHLCIRLNIALSVCAKLCAMAIGLSGDLELWVAVVVDVGTLVAVVLLSKAVLAIADVWERRRAR